MGLIHFFDPFQITSGSESISVGAPHHGTRPNVNADLVTGPIAQALAKRLGARGVIVSDLRRTVDVNKNPNGLAKNVRHHALRYQNEIFYGLPRLIIEIHGHVSGQYPIEIATGFDLDPASPGDALYLERLQKLKQTLPILLAGKIGQSHEVGIYPLDRDVKKTATNTYTFQKIRRARNRVGLEWYGLHIELSAALRTSKSAMGPGYIDALADVFAGAIQTAFLPLHLAGATIPTHADIVDEDVSSGIVLQVSQALVDTAEKNIANLHPNEMNALGFLEGDLLSLYHHGEQMRVPVTSSAAVRLKCIAIPARIRRQLDLTPGDSVTILQGGKPGATNVSANYQSFIIGATRHDRKYEAQIHPAGLQRLNMPPKTASPVKGPFPSSEPVSAQLDADDSLQENIVIVSDSLMQKLLLSIGDILMIRTNV